MNSLTVRIFDEEHKKVDTRFLDICTISGVNAATAQAIFDKMNSVLLSHNISWDNCVGIGADNASVNIGKHNSIMTRVQTIIQQEVLGWKIIQVTNEKLKQRR